MLHFRRENIEPIYKYEDWKITEDEFKINNNHRNETIFAQGNGYMGLRGIFEEDYSGPEYATTPGIYINGVYASEDMIYGESFPELPEKSQTIVNLADWTSINLYLEKEKFDMLQGKVENYRRSLDMKKGIVTRELTWASPQGRKVKIKITRLLSFVNPHLGIINYQVKPINFSGKIRIVSALDGNVRNYHQLRNKKQLQVKRIEKINNTFYLQQEVTSTSIDIGFMMRDLFYLDYKLGSAAAERKEGLKDGKISEHFSLDIKKGQEIMLQKYLYFYTSEDEIFLSHEKEIKNGKDILDNALQDGWREHLKLQKRFMENYWYDVDIKITGDVSLQQAFRFNAFHLLQSTGRKGLRNIAAKGLTGEFYGGHYFWDTETYTIPFFLYNRPEVARDLLMYRYQILDNARRNARRVKLDGALFPWRTINGDEASGFFMGSTVQYHIDADIAHAIYLYDKSTADQDFIYDYGAEIIMETARMWSSLGSYIELKNNKFCLNEVCGPDEYKPGVNNNCYTNYMAKFNLEYALELVERMKEKVPRKYNKLQKKINLSDREIEDWQKASDSMYLPYNDKLGIHPQDDSFLYKNYIDIAAIPEEEFPLVRNWHPLVIWRYQLIKQADVLLLMFLRGDKFSREEKIRNYEYYEPKTTHDSSLSPSIHSIIASEIGNSEDAYFYFYKTARLDLDDINRNAYQGIHTACMASTWMSVVHGFAGMRNYDGRLSFNPYLPDDWDGYEFKIRFQGNQLLVNVAENEIKYTLLKGEKIKFLHDDKEVKLRQGEDVVLAAGD